MTRQENERAAVQAQVAVEEAAQRAQVMVGFSPPSGKLFDVDVQGMMVIGPAGGVGTTLLLARTIAILAAPGRHAPEALLSAGWRDIEHLNEGLDAFAGKLRAIGLVLNRRKTGLQITKARTGSP